MANTVSATATRTAPARYEGFDNMLMNGKWRQGRSDQFGDDLDPYTNDVLVRIRLANQQDLNDAFLAAATAQPGWHEMLPGERSTIIRRAAEIMEDLSARKLDH